MPPPSSKRPLSLAPRAISTPSPARPTDARVPQDQAAHDALTLLTVAHVCSRPPIRPHCEHGAAHASARAQLRLQQSVRGGTGRARSRACSRSPTFTATRATRRRRWWASTMSTPPRRSVTSGGSTTRCADDSRLPAHLTRTRKSHTYTHTCTAFARAAHRPRSLSRACLCAGARRTARPVRGPGCGP